MFKNMVRIKVRVRVRDRVRVRVVFRVRVSGDGNRADVFACVLPLQLADVFFAQGKEMFYLTTHSAHFIYGYMASDIW